MSFHTLVFVRCDSRRFPWSNARSCHAIGPQALTASTARGLARAEGWRQRRVPGTYGNKTHAIDLCPACVEEYDRRKKAEKGQPR